jgi:hypothetical protein
MVLQLDTVTRNARADAVETAIGASPIMKIRSGAPPANTAAAATGTVLATITLPADWLTAASAGVKTLSGTWTDSSADAAGTAGWFEILESSGTTRRMQGTVTATGGGGDMEIDNVVFAVGQAFSVTAFTLTEPNS